MPMAEYLLQMTGRLLFQQIVPDMHVSSLSLFVHVNTTEPSKGICYCNACVFESESALPRQCPQDGQGDIKNTRIYVL